MKAIVVERLGGPEVLTLRELPTPVPEAHEVLIRVIKTSVNFADIKARQGRYHGGSKLPFIPGLDAVGIVEQVGSAVKTVQPGMRVAAFPSQGAYAEWVVAPQALVFPLPDGLSWDQAAALPIVALTAYKLLHDVARIEPGETILIHAAAGGVGTTAVQLARILKATCIIGTVGRDEKKAVPTSLGADAVINYNQEDFVAAVNRITGGAGVDVVLDSIGGGVSERSLEVLRDFGRLVHYGSASGDVGSIRVGDLHGSCRSVLGYSLGTVRNERPELLQGAARTVMGYVVEGNLVMQIGRHFSLAEMAAAHQWMESRQSTGKILIDVAGEWSLTHSA